MSDSRLSVTMGYTLLSLVLVATLTSIYETVTRRASVPSRETWSAAVERIKPLLKEGDYVTWYPEWAGEARLSLHGLPITALPHSGEVDLGHATRLWVLGAFGFNGQKLAQSGHLSPLQELEVVSVEHIKVKSGGEVSLTLLNVNGAKVRHDLHTALSDPTAVQVYRSSLRRSSPLDHRASELGQCDLWALNGWHCTPASPRRRRQVERCLNKPQKQQLKSRSKRRALYTLDRRRWLPYVDCRLNPTEHVSRDWRVIEGTPRRCLSLIPHKGREVELRWTIPSHQAGQSLWLYYGWEDLAVRHPFRASKASPIEFEIKRGESRLFKHSLNPKRSWTREIVELSAEHLEGPPAPISIIYRAPQGVEDGNFCISLNVRDQSHHEKREALTP